MPYYANFITGNTYPSSMETLTNGPFFCLKSGADFNQSLASTINLIPPVKRDCALTCTQTPLKFGKYYFANLLMNIYYKTSISGPVFHYDPIVNFKTAGMIKQEIIFQAGFSSSQIVNLLSDDLEFYVGNTQQLFDRGIFLNPYNPFYTNFYNSAGPEFLYSIPLNFSVEFFSDCFITFFFGVYDITIPGTNIENILAAMLNDININEPNLHIDNLQYYFSFTLNYQKL